MNRDKSTKRWFNHSSAVRGVAGRELAAERGSPSAGASAAGSHSALSAWAGNARVSIGNICRVLRKAKLHSATYMNLSFIQPRPDPNWPSARKINPISSS